MNKGAAVFSARLMYRRKSGWSVRLQAAGDWRPCSVREPFGHRVSCAALGLDVSYDRNWNQRAYICQGQRHGFEIAEYCDGMDSVRLSMSQSSLEMLGKQIRFFMCLDDFFAQKISAECIMKIPYLALVFCLLWLSRDLRKAQTFCS